MCGSISFVSSNGLRNDLDSGEISGSIFLYCKIPDIFGWWSKILGSILFLLESSWQWRNIIIYLICTEKFLTFLDGGGISQGLFFVLQNSYIFEQWRYIRIYSICTAKFLTFLDGGGILDLLYLYCKFYYLGIASCFYAPK